MTISLLNNPFHANSWKYIKSTTQQKKIKQYLAVGLGQENIIVLIKKPPDQSFVALVQAPA